MRYSRHQNLQQLFSTTGALRVRIGFWDPLYYTLIIRNPQRSTGNYEGSYVTLLGEGRSLQLLGADAKGGHMALLMAPEVALGKVPFVGGLFWGV